MRGWIEGFQESVDFIERNLTEELDIEEIADSIDVINRATCDLVDSMRNIGAELIQD